MTPHPKLTLALQRRDRAREELRQASAEVNALVVALASEDYPKVQIARDLGVHPSRVTHIFTAHKDAPRDAATSEEPTASEEHDAASQP